MSRIHFLHEKSKHLLSQREVQSLAKYKLILFTLRNLNEKAKFPQSSKREEKAAMSGNEGSNPSCGI